MNQQVGGRGCRWPMPVVRRGPDLRKTCRWMRRDDRNGARASRRSVKVKGRGDKARENVGSKGRLSLPVKPPRAIPARRCDGALNIVSRHLSKKLGPAGPAEARALANRTGKPTWPNRLSPTLRTALRTLRGIAAVAWKNRDDTAAAPKCRRSIVGAVMSLKGCLSSIWRPIFGPLS